MYIIWLCIHIYFCLIFIIHFLTVFLFSLFHVRFAVWFTRCLSTFTLLLLSFLLLSSREPAKGRTNVELREQFILADGVSQSMTPFKAKRTASISATGPITKVGFDYDFERMHGIGTGKGQSAYHNIGFNYGFERMYGIGGKGQSACYNSRIQLRF